MVSSDVVIGASFLIMFTTIGHLPLGLGFWTVLNISYYRTCRIVAHQTKAATENDVTWFVP